MNNEPPPQIIKWPFLVGDMLLLVAAVAVQFQSPAPLTLWHHLLTIAAVGLGASLLAIPYILEHKGEVRLLDSAQLTSSLAQIHKLEALGQNVAASTAHWQSIHDQNNRTVLHVREVAEKMSVETRQLAEAIKKADDSDKNHLRLEVEKLRRGEGEWLQIVVRILDHVFALSQAAERSGQPTLMEQINQFQYACRDSARRIGLVPITVVPNDFFDPNRHQVFEAPEPDAGKRIATMLATGFTLQGQLIRKVLVTVVESDSSPTDSKKPEAPTALPAPLPPASEEVRALDSVEGSEISPVEKTAAGIRSSREKFAASFEATEPAKEPMDPASTPSDQKFETNPGGRFRKRKKEGSIDNQDLLFR